MRHGHAERLGGLESDGQLEFHRLLDRQLSRLFSFENSSGIDAGEAQHIVEIGSVTNQPTNRDEFTKSVTCGNCVARAASSTSWSRRAVKSASAPTMTALTPCRTKLANAASISRSVLTCTIGRLSPSARAAACTSLV